MTGCASSQVTALPANTNTPTQTNITPTEKPATPTFTPDPLAGAPEGTTGKNKETGEWVKIVEENGHTYEYEWIEDLQKWMRSLGTIPLWDNTVYNYIPLTVYSVLGVPGEEKITDISHEDVVSGGNNPLTTSFRPKLKERLQKTGEVDWSANDFRPLQEQMRRGIQSEAFLPVETSSGEQVDMRLSTETGFIVRIVSSEDLKPLVGNGVSDWKGLNTIFYSRVVGVNDEGSLICDVASDISIDELTDEQFLLMIFSCVGSVLKYESQVDMGNTDWGQVLAQAAAELRDGQPDVGINRVPQSE